jgi:excisionase family DNA binding protein
VTTTRHVPRVTLSRAEAAESLGVSIDTFERYVQPDLKVIRTGRLVLVPLAELERWASDNAERVLVERGAESGNGFT